MALYTPGTENGQILTKAELALIAAGFDAIASYGGMRIDTGRSVILGTTALKVTAWDTVAPQAKVTADAVLGSLTVAAAGVYEFLLVLYLDGVDSAVTYEVEARVNDQAAGAVPGNAPEKKTDRVDLSATSAPVSLAAGDEVALYLKADAASTVTLSRAMMSIKRIG